MRSRRRLRAPGWMAWSVLIAAVLFLGRRRGRRIVSKLTRALTDRALRALSETFRDEPERGEDAEPRGVGARASRGPSPA